MVSPNDFDVSKFYIYKGSNLYLNKKAIVFNIYLDPDGPEVNYYKETVYKEFPELANRRPSTVIDLFASTLLQVMRLGYNTYLKEYSIKEDGDEFVVAVEYCIERKAENCVSLVSEWFKSMNQMSEFGFNKKWSEVQDGQFKNYIEPDESNTEYFAPAVSRNIPMFKLEEEGSYQFGYGKKQLRTSQSEIQKDSYIDMELLGFEELNYDFFDLYGFPVIRRKVCFAEEEAVEEAMKLGFPVSMRLENNSKDIRNEIDSKKTVELIFEDLMNNATNGDGVVVEKENGKKNFYLWTIDGKFAGAVEVVPAYVTGNGHDNMKTLIENENSTSYRRPPFGLHQIEMDNVLDEILESQKMGLHSVPKKGQNVVCGPVNEESIAVTTINVTKHVHPSIIQLIEHIAKLFRITCLEFYALADDITVSRYESKFAIDGVGVFPQTSAYNLVCVGDYIDIVGKIFDSHFKQPEFARIPIIAGNSISQNIADSIYKKLKALKQDVFFGSLTSGGVYFNGSYITKNERHDNNVKIILRDPRMDFALFCHDRHDILDFGFFHDGADLVILDNANEIEESMKSMLTTNDYLVEISEHQIDLIRNGAVLSSISFYNEEDKEKLLLSTIEPLLKELLNKYE